MAVIKIDQFRGMSERVNAKKLPDGMATFAQNVDFSHGTLHSIDNNVIVSGASADFGSFSANTDTLFITRGGDVLAFDDVVDIVESPIPDDSHERIYFTGNASNPPQVASAQSLGNMYEITIPRPPAPTVTLNPTTTGNADTENPVSTAYIATYVTAFGEEGPPSVVGSSDILDIYSDQTVSVTVGAATGTRNYANIRIYRTDANGTFRFLHQVSHTGNVGSAFVDNVDDSGLGEEVPTTDHVGPDANMIGLTSMPNGITAGFFDQTLCFSEAYLPHAWPESYRLTTAYDIVGLARMDTGLLVLTKGKPYMVQGSDPSGLVMTELDIAQSCLAKRSIVDMGDSVMYASPDGLVRVTPSGAQVVTEAIFSKKQWNSLPLSLLRSVRHEDIYVGFADFSDGKEGFIFDPKGGMDAFAYLEFGTSHVVAAFNHLEEDKTHVVFNTAQKGTFASGTTGRQYEWHSKHFFSPRPLNFGVMQVEFGTNFTNNGNTEIRLKGGLDEPTTLIKSFTFQESSSQDVTQTLRLPSGTKYHTFSVEAEGFTEIVSIALAESMAELR